MDGMAYLGFLRRKLLYITEDREPSEMLLSSAVKQRRGTEEEDIECTAAITTIHAVTGFVWESAVFGDAITEYES